MKYLLSIIGILALLAAGVFVGVRFGSQSWFATHETEKSTVLLQEIKDVMKLVTIEGYFSEVYDYKDYYWADWKPFSKKALIRVKAKVSIGYDLEQMTFRADGLTKTIYITGLPKPELLSIDHDLDYYDLQEGSFNSFSTEDYNTLNKRAKDFITSKVEDSELYDRAEEQISDVQAMVESMVVGQGWRVIFADVEDDSLELID